ncbi:MAG: hypothetical protein LBT05_11745 [Planctomycetaceae bacterium]|nr:hypothetical protein [Planctomycetaceae bacterium]
MRSSLHWSRFEREFADLFYKTFFQTQAVFPSTSLAKWRDRIGEEKMKTLIAETIRPERWS